MMKKLVGIDFTDVQKEENKLFLYAFFKANLDGKFYPFDKKSTPYIFNYQKNIYEVTFRQRCYRSQKNSNELIVVDSLPIKKETLKIKKSTRLRRQNILVIAYLRLNDQTQSIDLVVANHDYLQVKFRDTVAYTYNNAQLEETDHHRRLAREPLIYDALYGFGFRLFSKTEGRVKSCVPYFAGIALENNLDQLNSANIKPIIHDIIYFLCLLHQKNLVHMDVSLSNIIINDTGARLTDFDLTRQENQSATSHIGSPGTMAPEILNLGQANNNSVTITKAIDFFSLAVVLLKMLTKQQDVNFLCTLKYLVPLARLHPAAEYPITHIKSKAFRFTGNGSIFIFYDPMHFPISKDYHFTDEEQKTLREIVSNLAFKEPTQRKLINWHNNTLVGFWPNPPKKTSACLSLTENTAPQNKP